MNPRPFLVAALLAACSLEASAETFRCGSRVISTAVGPAEILQLCGEPSSRTSTTEDVRAKNQYGLWVTTGQTTVEKWTFDRGSQAAPIVVTIVDGKVKSIDRQK